MTNIFFENEEISKNDLYFLCYMVERLARRLHQHNAYIINKIPYSEWMRLISLAGVLHSENPLKVEEEWIEEYELQKGDFDILKVDPELVEKVPSVTQMGKVYTRLIIDTMISDENYIDAMSRVYNDEICEKIDDYNCGAYYEPSYIIARAYNEGGF